MANEISAAFPPPLESLPVGDTLAHTLSLRFAAEPIFFWGLLLFALAIVHTFVAPFIARLGHRLMERRPLLGRFLELLGEVEVVFVIWAIPLFLALAAYQGYHTALGYITKGVNYTEPLFVMTIMALAATRPVLAFSEQILGQLARLMGGGVQAWWFVLLTAAPLLGSLITEPAAMTIAALLLAKRFYELRPSHNLAYATLGVLFVNVSVGGVLTHFAAPPVVMVAQKWGLDTPFMFTHFGWHAIVGVICNALLVRLFFAREFHRLDRQPVKPVPASGIPLWVTLTHLVFILMAVIWGHYAPIFLFVLLGALWFIRATPQHQEELSLAPALKVGIFLCGLVIFGGLQQWWIAPLLGGLPPFELFSGATFLTSFNDNAAITYLASLVPHLTAEQKFAVLSGAVAGGGLTVIANAPNPAGQAILKKYFSGGTVSPIGLLLAAAIPTLVIAWAFMGLPH
jgi:hypothetical protein